MRRSLGFLFCALFFSSTGQAIADYYDGLRAFDQKKYETAINEWKASANKGDGRSAFRLGELHQKGIGIKKDRAEAYFWYRAAAIMGNQEAAKAAASIRAKLILSKLIFLKK